ncbi:MAG: hypothetical protein QOI41_6990, partial [Myxococcales bacterium]|nr:hypothetical protein [Myxococcales bacterium]
MKRSFGVIRSLVVVTSLGCAASASSACGSTSDTSGAPAPVTTTAPAAPATTAADELSIDEVAVYQAVKTTIVKGGAVAKPNAPI